VQLQRVGHHDAVVDGEQLVELGPVDARELLAILTPTREVARLVARRAVAVVDEVLGERRLDEIEVAVAHLERDVPDEFETVQVRLSVRCRAAASLL
jgi:hypothetical protein